jgi:hypothetical protein
MKRSLIAILPQESLLKMPTKQLLGRLQALQKCEESAAFSDRTTKEAAASNGILYKDTTEWREAYCQLKAVLATREHLPTADERAKVRMERGRLRRGRTAGYQRGHSVNIIS